MIELLVPSEFECDLKGCRIKRTHRHKVNRCCLENNKLAKFCRTCGNNLVKELKEEEKA